MPPEQQLLGSTGRGDHRRGDLSGYLDVDGQALAAAGYGARAMERSRLGAGLRGGVAPTGARAIGLLAPVLYPELISNPAREE